MPAPFKVKAVFEYKSDEPDDLNFPLGQIITVTEEDDADWYTGEYNGADGKAEGIFPRNFVEKYEPAIPSRPMRNVHRAIPPPDTAAEAVSIPEPTPASSPQAVPEVSAEPSKQAIKEEWAEEPVPKPAAEARPTDNKPPAAKKPPPVAEKPASSSFKDRIAAFNKPAAAPISPFKPGGTGSSSFIKKPFVAPPPSRNSYVPPPAQAPAPAKIYKRDEDPELTRQEDEDVSAAADTSRNDSLHSEDQPKPTSLKDRIALLQQQQLEQAQLAAEKRRAKKPPPPQRTNSTDNNIDRARTTEAPLNRQQLEETAFKEPIESERYQDDGEEDDVHTPEHEIAIPIVVSPPPRELVSDTNDADDSGAADTDAPETSPEDDLRRSRSIKSPPIAVEPVQTVRREQPEEVAGEEVEGEEDTEEEEDPEVRRRRELRERMAKMSGGMGMMGMFGPPGGMAAPSKKPKGPKIERSAQEPEPQEETFRAPPVPIMALPGMSTRPQPKTAEDSEEEEEEFASPTPMEPKQKSVAEDEDYVSDQPTKPSGERSGPSSPYERAAPPAPARETRAPPPAPPSVTSLSDPPLSPPGRSNLPPPPPPTRDDSIDRGDFAQPLTSGRTSLDTRPLRQPSTRKDPSSLPPGAPPPPPARTLTSDSITSAGSAQEKRMSRPPPLPPTAAPSSPQTRAPPPPPPGQPPSRSATTASRASTRPSDDVEEESEEEVTEYDGDYDTDIASSAKHKDALKAHNRDSSIDDEGTLTDEAHKLPSSPPARAVPPLPPTNPSRELPPPPPPASAPKARPSGEAPRMAPPPIPSAPAMGEQDDGDYDPYRYSGPQHGLPSPPIPHVRAPPVPPPPQESEEDDMYDAPPHPAPSIPARSQPPPPPTERMAPPPPSERAAPPPPPHTDMALMAGGLGPAPFPPSIPKQSVDLHRAPTTSRRSAEQPRPSADFGFMASDVDVGESTLWWTQDNVPPPSVAPRTDILYEVESNIATKRGGKTTINRDVYILYIDYSQTTINVSFDPNDPSNASISQSHQRPPPPPRQDQLESASHSFGSKVAAAASQASGTTVADGSAQGFIWTLLQPFRGSALMPIGHRSFGATVYSNLANASTQQFDEIRAGDIVTFRNAKFSGHKGGLHQKYSMEAGQPGKDHVAVVIDWDGTKKKIRAWEQGRDDKKGSKGKVKEESFRVGDLKSGEVRVWRIMGRSWVGWDSS